MLADEIRKIVRERVPEKNPLEDGSLFIVNKRGFRAHSISDAEPRIYTTPTVRKEKNLLHSFMF